MAALTVDLQDLCCHVGVGQRLVLHTAGVRNTVIPSVHLKLQGAPDCEGFSCRVHMCSACKEPRCQPESKRGSKELVKWILMMTLLIKHIQKREHLNDIKMNNGLFVYSLPISPL